MKQKRSKKKSKKSHIPVHMMDKEWSYKVKEVAGFKCELCGDTTGPLEAHDIQPRRLRATRWYLPNGVCVCHKCHTKGPYSAHKNPISFILSLIRLRGDLWAYDLATETTTTDYKERIEEIRSQLNPNPTIELVGITTSQ